jgi:hypothetical protein
MDSMQMLQGACGACPAGSAIAVARAFGWKYLMSFGVLIEPATISSSSAWYAIFLFWRRICCFFFFGLVGI